jgi:hypothetical protein
VTARAKIIKVLKTKLNLDGKYDKILNIVEENNVY